LQFFIVPHVLEIPGNFNLKLSRRYHQAPTLPQNRTHLPTSANIRALVHYYVQRGMCASCFNFADTAGVIRSATTCSSMKITVLALRATVHNLRLL
jgi:hypothetical protein